MVTEKADAFTQSSRSVASATKALQTAGEASVRDFGKLAGGGIFWPSDYMRIAERNASVFAAMVAMPGKAIAPIHKRVTSNARRLGS